MPDTTRPSQLSGLSPAHRRSIACGILTGVVFVSAAVLARRISGDASAITTWAASLTGAVAIGVAILCATIPGVLHERLEIADRILATGLASIPGLLLGLSLLPAGSFTGVSSLLGIYLVAVIAGTFGTGTIPQQSLPFVKPVLASSEPLVRPTSHSEVAVLEKPTATAWPTDPPSESQPLDLNLQAEAIPHPSGNPQTTQWMSRAITADGENAEGGCQVDFVPEQKVVAAHILFTPAFDAVPEFECEPLDESDVRVKVTTRQRYGVRIEVTRVGNLAMAQSIPLGWFAFAEPTSTAEKVAA